MSARPTDLRPVDEAAEHLGISVSVLRKRTRLPESEGGLRLYEAEEDAPAAPGPAPSLVSLAEAEEKTKGVRRRKKSTGASGNARLNAEIVRLRALVAALHEAREVARERERAVVESFHEEMAALDVPDDVPSRYQTARSIAQARERFVIDSIHAEASILDSVDRPPTTMPTR